MPSLQSQAGLCDAHPSGLTPAPRTRLGQHGFDVRERLGAYAVTEASVRKYPSPENTKQEPPHERRLLSFRERINRSEVVWFTLRESVPQGC